MGWGQLVQQATRTPARVQPVQQDVSQVERLDVGPAHDAAAIGPQPPVEVGQQGLRREIGPTLFRQGLVEKADARLNGASAFLFAVIALVLSVRDRPRPGQVRPWGWLIAFGLGTLLLDDPDSQRVAIIEAGVPTMMLLVIMGQRYKLDTDFIASAILATMVGAVVTIPVLQLLLG